jgi:hypothetical protein
MSDATYLESLKVAWLLLWRGLLIGLGISFAVGLVLGFLAALIGVPKEATTIGGVLIGVLLGLFYIYPLTVRMALKKQFEGFKLQIVHS